MRRVVLSLLLVAPCSIDVARAAPPLPEADIRDISPHHGTSAPGDESGNAFAAAGGDHDRREARPRPDVVAGEPSLAELRAAAVALTLAEPQRARSLVERARWAGVLPQLTLAALRRAGSRASLDVNAVEPSVSPIELWTSEDLRYEGRATWDLAKLLFNPDELTAQAQALRMADVRREVELLVIRLYFERRRLLEDGEPRQSRSGRVDEIEAELDALSGGLLSRRRATPPRQTDRP